MVEGRKILLQAQKIAATARTWADLSNAIFDPLEGLVAKAYPSLEDRKALSRTATYRELHALVQNAMTTFGVIEGANPKKRSGRFVVRLPKSLHSSLAQEAERESVSLNQLVVSKLACQLQALTGDPMQAVIQAFGEVREGRSSDRVVADPEANRRFIDRCRELGAQGTDFDLNWRLYNARKNGYLAELPRTKRYTVRESDQFEFASEIALRLVQDKELRDNGRKVSLDLILCDPSLAATFDSIAGRLAPGYTPLQYRWVALGLRKAARLKNRVRSAKTPQFERLGPVDKIRISSIPDAGGIYKFTSRTVNWYVGQTSKLRERIGRHFESSPSHGLPEWLFEETPRLILSIANLPKLGIQARHAMELRTIQELNPSLNYRSSVA